jgi:hypothetical protein
MRWAMACGGAGPAGILPAVTLTTTPWPRSGRAGPGRRPPRHGEERDAQGVEARPDGIGDGPGAVGVRGMGRPARCPRPRSEGRPGRTATRAAGCRAIAPLTMTLTTSQPRSARHAPRPQGRLTSAWPQEVAVPAAGGDGGPAATMCGAWQTGAAATATGSSGTQVADRGHPRVQPDRAAAMCQGAPSSHAAMT